MITLYEYQKEIFEISKDREYYALFMETGTGKTIVALETVKHLFENKKIECAIIAAPKSVCRPVWLNYLDKFYNELDYFVFQWIGDLSHYQQSLWDKILLRNIKSDKLMIFIINSEAFSHKRVYELVFDITRKYKSIFILDESTSIKSPKTNITKGLLNVSMKVNYKRILSGYPVLKSPEDLYTQVRFLSQRAIPYQSFYAFRNEFCNIWMNGRIPIIKGYKNLDKLSGLIQPFTIRILKKDCLDLPPKVREIRYVEMTADQKGYYDNMKNEGYLTLKNSDKQTFASTLLVQLERLHQLANGLILNLQVNIPINKYSIVAELLKTELAHRQVVVWCSYVNNIILLQQFLYSQNISSRMLYGDTPQTQRELNIKDFQEEKYQVMITNPAVTRFGNDFTCSSYSIYFSNHFNLEHRIQSEDRLHRINQVNKVTYIDLVTEHTIEEKILKILERKHSVGAEILKDEWESWFRD